MKLEQGNKYIITTKEEQNEGTFINETDKHIYIKLKSGYNIGIDKTKVETIKKISEKPTRTEMKTEKEIQQKNKNLPNITILHTGGTIASKVDYTTGAVIAKFTEKELVELFPELTKIANIDSKLVRNMQSEMIRFAHYNLLAKAAKDEAEKGADGIIITHGTDTLPQTSAALSFALENIGIPLILVGSQRSSDRPSSDASLNLISAAKFIANTDYSGVAICMHEDINDKTCLILPGLKTKKMHTSKRDAFKPINTKPIASINADTGKTEFRSNYIKKDKHKKITLKLFNEKIKIGLLEAHPQMYAEEIDNYKKFDGLVIKLLGLGHLPTMQIDEYTEENEKILKSIKELTKTIPVVASPQTICGRINMNIYTPGKQLIEAGVIGNYTDIHPETAFIKLAWLLSNYKKEEIKNLYETNLRGEITERIEED